MRWVLLVSPSDTHLGQSGGRTSSGEAWDAERRENQLVAMAEAGQKLAIQWGHQPWSDSWARLVAEALEDAAANANHWRCECGDANGLHEAFCYRCGGGGPEGA